MPPGLNRSLISEIRYPNHRRNTATSSFGRTNLYIITQPPFLLWPHFRSLACCSPGFGLPGRDPKIPNPGLAESGEMHVNKPQTLRRESAQIRDQGQGDSAILVCEPQDRYQCIFYPAAPLRCRDGEHRALFFKYGLLTATMPVPRQSSRPVFTGRFVIG
jgi:hypothetical protein